MPETNAEYHADFDYVSHSMLEVFRRSPAEYYVRYIARTLPPAEQTPEMLLGSLTHCVVLEPERLDEEYLVAGDCRRRYGAEWENWEAEAQAVGKTLILREQLELAQAMARSVSLHPKARAFLEAEGIVERPIRLTDEQFGIKCKIKPDKLIRRKSGIVMWDLKTAADPRGRAFGRQAGEFGLLRQAAYYITVVKAKYGDVPVAFYFIVVGKTPPHDVWVYRLTPRQYSAGMAQNAEILAGLREAMDTERWVGRFNGTSQDEICDLDIPEHFLTSA